jgi:hypothetical protein
MRTQPNTALEPTVTAPQRRSPRFVAFMRVLVEAAKPPPLSLAFADYRAASSDAERRAAYASLTQADRDAIIADARKSCDARIKVLADERRADAAAFKARSDDRAAAITLAEDARIAALPSAIRRRVEWRRLILKIACVTGTCLAIAFSAAQLTGEVGYFVWNLFHYWIFWVLLLGVNIVIFSVVMIAAHWRVIASVLRALPTAIYAAITTGPE